MPWFRQTKNLGIQNANQATIQEFLGSSLLAPSSPWSRYPQQKTSQEATWSTTILESGISWGLKKKPGAKQLSLKRIIQIWKYGWPTWSNCNENQEAKLSADFARASMMSSRNRPTRMPDRDSWGTSSCTKLMCRKWICIKLSMYLV